MSGVFERTCCDSRRREIRLLVVIALALLAASALWHTIRGDLVYRLGCNSIGNGSRLRLIAAALRPRIPRFPDDDPRFWFVSWENPEWIAWSFRWGLVTVGGEVTAPKRQVTVADHDLTVRGIVAGDRLSLPPADRDRDGLCEVAMKIDMRPEDYGRDRECWVVLRLHDDHNEIVWAGLLDRHTWYSQGILPNPMWRDEDGDGRDEFVFVTVEFVRTPTSVTYKPSRTIAVFEWAEPGGVLRPRSLPDDCGIQPWDRATPLRVNQTADLDELVRELLPAE